MPRPDSSTMRLAKAVALFSLAAAALACPRSSSKPPAQDAGTMRHPRGPFVCIETPDGCIDCAGPDLPADFLEPDQSRPLVCDPQDDEDCVEFCSEVTPSCALSWSKERTCVVESKVEFHRTLFDWRTADRPEVVLFGRIEDEARRRLEGARILVWVAGGTGQALVPLGNHLSAKDGTFRVPLRSGPWTYALSISRAGHATEIIEGLAADRLDRASSAGQPRVFRLETEQVIRGKVVDLANGAPVAGASVQAFGAPQDPVEVSHATTAEDGSFSLSGLKAQRYSVRVEKFGWSPLSMKAPVAAPSQRVTLKLLRASVIRGLVVDTAGEPEPNATVAAVLSATPGGPTLLQSWATDSDGTFRWDRFEPGTYYLWARRGEMFAYPPSRIDLGASLETEVTMALSRRGSRVAGRLVARQGTLDDVEVRALPRSPLAFPRNAAARVDAQGAFVLGGLLPGRYELSVRSRSRPMAISKGPRAVEVPIEPGSTVTLKEEIVVRPQAEE